MAHSQAFFFCFTDLWVGKNPRRRKWQPGPVSAWESHGQSLAGSGPWWQKVRTQLSEQHFHPHFTDSELLLRKSATQKHQQGKAESTCKTLLSVAKEPKVRSSNKEKLSDTTVKTGAPNIAAKGIELLTCSIAGYRDAPVSTLNLVSERTNRRLELCPCWVERSSTLCNIKVDFTWRVWTFVPTV